MCTEKKRALPPSINTPFKQQIKPKINVTAEDFKRATSTDTYRAKTKTKAECLFIG